ncbi:hypothetical protein J7384_16775 [Endozoicomonas sp. G2_1]|uniref:hypothetical protein n=1 Tax=Endozoicomonas sp. G2_1 TaxID=2821091 RepID=UPI001ADD2DAC|nr:hypothetical protein [Endozoicomonas sp. G2_1]MBO9492017.1 hypothetical protein [Endozoicomonas sp. G2_1]
MIAKSYKAVFVLPKETEKKLGEYGWEFNSKTPMDIQIVNALLAEFPELVKGETDVNTFRKADLIIDIVNESSNADYMYIRDYSDNKSNLNKIVSLFGDNPKLDVFVP